MISTLKGLTFGTVVGSKGVEAVEMAISALERIEGLEGASKQFMWERDIAISQLKELGYEFGQKIEPCEDAVSRDAVLKKAVYTETEEGWCGYTVDVDYIKSLSPVTPKPTECEDAISREELLKAIETWDKFGCDADTKLVPYKDHYIPYIHYDDVIKAIKGMPSVTPSRHKGQGHWKEPKNPYDIDGTYYCYCSECECDANEQTDFCPNCGAEMESK